MALVVICGQPCSGKSTAALCLSEALQSLNLQQAVRIVDESSFHLDRNQNYIDMNAEKNLRGVLRSEVDRSVSKDNIVIVDSLNSIKGYRYELWCLARAAGIRYCVIYLDMEEDHSREWNKERGEKGEATYDDKIFEDLVRRFEKPDKRNRWDSPLFELYPSKDGINQSSTGILDAVSYVTKKVDSKSRDVRLLQPTIATQNARVSEANSLYVMDRATQECTAFPWNWEKRRRIRRKEVRLISTEISSSALIFTIELQQRSLLSLSLFHSLILSVCVQVRVCVSIFNQPKCYLGLDVYNCISMVQYVL